MSLSIYKRGQGKYTRLLSAVGAATVVGVGCMQLYKTLQPFELGPWVTTMTPVAVFVVLGLAIVWVVNRPSVADFMIVAEGEMKKVNWSSRKEIAVSTFVVIAVVVIFAVLLGAFDIGFRVFFNWLLDVVPPSTLSAAA